MLKDRFFYTLKNIKNNNQLLPSNRILWKTEISHFSRRLLNPHISHTYAFDVWSQQISHFPANLTVVFLPHTY